MLEVSTGDRTVFHSWFYHAFTVKPEENCFLIYLSTLQRQFNAFISYAATHEAAISIQPKVSLLLHEAKASSAKTSVSLPQ